MAQGEGSSGAGNGNGNGGRSEHTCPNQLTRRTPIWRGDLICIWDRNFSVFTDPKAQRDAYSARLWAGVGAHGDIWFARGRSQEGPVDALIIALREIINRSSALGVPDVTLASSPTFGLLHPKDGTHSPATVRARLRVSNDPDEPTLIEVETSFHDFDTALFLAYCRAYDEVLVAQWSKRLELAKMTPADAFALMARDDPAVSLTT
ncbi:MAG: hypothetical protein V1723_00110 [Candidatus Uhrbacteria bacterium]